MKIYNIVLTGGPSGEKTTILNEIKARFDDPEKKIRVVTVPEVATYLFNCNIPILGGEKAFNYQSGIYRSEKHNEKIMNYMATLTDAEKVLIVYDRAIMDNKAYLTDELFETLIKAHKDDELNLTDFYDLVINLQSASNIKGLYKQETNPARVEKADAAQKLGERTTESWLLHRNFYNLLATKDFNDKKESVIKIIDDYVNKELLDLKYLFIDVGIGRDFAENCKSVHIKETEIFLENDKENMESITKRENEKGDVSYIYQKFTITRQGKVIKENRSIPLEAVNILLKNKNVKDEIEIERYNCVNDKGEAFEMTFSNDVCFLRPLYNNGKPNYDLIDDKYVTGICDCEDYYKFLFKKGKGRKLL